MSGDLSIKEFYNVRQHFFNSTSELFSLIIDAESPITIDDTNRRFWLSFKQAVEYIYTNLDTSSVYDVNNKVREIENASSELSNKIKKGEIDAELATHISSLIERSNKLYDLWTNKLRPLKKLFDEVKSEARLEAQKTIKDIVDNNKEYIREMDVARTYVSELGTSTLNEMYSLQEQAQEVLRQIKEKSEVVSITTTAHIGDFITREYKQVVRREKLSAEILRGAAVICFLLSASIIFYNLFFNLSPVENFIDLLKGSGPVLFFTIPAFYFARESNKHRSAQHNYEHFALNYPVALQYISGMDMDSRKPFEVDLAKHLLIGPNSNQLLKPTSIENDDIEKSLLISQIEKLGTVVESLRTTLNKQKS